MHNCIDKKYTILAVEVAKGSIWVQNRFWHVKLRLFNDTNSKYHGFSQIK